jgi:hypothetical protein
MLTRGVVVWLGQTPFVLTEPRKYRIESLYIQTNTKHHHTRSIPRQPTHPSAQNPSVGSQYRPPASSQPPIPRPRDLPYSGLRPKVPSELGIRRTFHRVGNPSMFICSHPPARLRLPPRSRRQTALGCGTRCAGGRRQVEDGRHLGRRLHIAPSIVPSPWWCGG